MTTSLSQDIGQLDQFRATPLPADYPSDRRRLFVTQDQVQPAILLAVSSVTLSQACAMYSFDDEALVEQIVANYHSIEGGMPTLITQDESCYKTSEGTRVAAPLIALLGSPNFRWAVGTSDKGQISHMKTFVGDNAWLITGSTNWSKMGETEEDNECEFTINSVLAAEMTARIEAQYQWMMANCQQPGSGDSAPAEPPALDEPEGN